MHARSAADPSPSSGGLCIAPRRSSFRAVETDILQHEKQLDDAGFAACMAALGPFEQAPFLAIAVSGGADSLALTLLADRWARVRNGRVVGLTVDHGLRPDSLEEARQTGAWLRAADIEHHILPWLGEKPRTGLQRRARDARYALLAGWCRTHRCFHLLTAHHRQDQAETVALRKARQSGERGLAAMPLIREISGLRLLRPLLGIDKTRLEAKLRAAGHPWLKDPSNDSPAFTRNRLRLEGLDVASLAREAEIHGRRRQAADQLLAESLVRHVIIDPAGFATLDAAGFARLPPDLGRDLLARILVTIGGNAYPPRREAVFGLARAMLADPPVRARTLAHCRILKQRGHWLICRERAATGRLQLEPGRRQRWDERFVVHLKTVRHDLALEALGDRTRQAANALAQKEKSRTLPGAVKTTLPSVWKDDRLFAVPHLGLYHPSLAPHALDVRFCPSEPLAKAAFMPHITNAGWDETVAPAQR